MHRANSSYVHSRKRKTYEITRHKIPFQKITTSAILVAEYLFLSLQSFISKFLFVLDLNLFIKPYCFKVYES